MVYDELEKENYATSSIADEEDLLSLTEIGDDEKNWNPANNSTCLRSRTSRVIKRARRFRWLIDTILILVNISLSFLLLRDFRTENSSSSIQVGSDFTGTGPDFPTKIVRFAADESFVPTNTSEYFSDGVLAKWNTMMPAGAGWGAVKGDTFFTTTMTHQLHCVFMMMRIYSNLLENRRANLSSDYHSHYLHCVDYLRQGIMCSADLTMEPHGPADADDNGPLDGSWNGHHVCKDYSHVIPYLEGECCTNSNSNDVLTAVEQIAGGIRQVLPIDD
ncbi:hypothetical protein BDV96DRAFT_692759 [Lophiotrema nucula]|uniref:Oxidase ustYa n=1 Tax=Lophiotrema nucula TaxID=690887 RepID=A0A6A5YMU2_9PLEO|nr:hypothetical protein BDV96DRAFT_692759 [Lophiotrema nucula]